jgi:stage II sporulation protein AA (anti-sigma F factor antagonist)
MEIAVREVESVIIYDIVGDIRLIDETPVILHEEVKAHLAKGKRYFLFNLEHVKYMDSFGVGQLVSSHISISNVGGKLKLTNLVPRVRYIFDVTGLSRVLKLVDDEETALKNFVD